jgi:lysozyme
LSDAARQNLKVSREGIVLIKSFEGFRPRAIQRAEGGWIIGYGHTLSAREGATVSEADAELLLRYDLLPVEASVNGAVPAPLNQHQFDALVSFAFSVGVDRFASSDVRQRLAAGAPDEAADAIMGWPEPALPEAALRRRAAERALFVANPFAPVALSDLLSAPLPPPPVPAATEAPEAESVIEAEPVAVPEAARPADAEPDQHGFAIAQADPRGAAVAALLGEPPARLVQDEAAEPPIVPSFVRPVPGVEAIETSAPSNDNPSVEDLVEEAASVAEAPVPEREPELENAAVAAEPAVEDIVANDESATEDAAAAPSPGDESVPPEPVEDSTPDADETDGTDGTDPVEAISTDEPAQAEPTLDDVAEEAAPTPAVDAAAWSAARYAPYSLSMVGPLPYLQPATRHAEARTPAIDHAVVEMSGEDLEAAPIDEPTDIITTDAPGDDDVEPAVETAEVEPDRLEAPVVEAPESETLESETPEVDLTEASAVEQEADSEPHASTPVEPMTYVAPLEIAPVAELILTPLEDAPEPVLARPLWTAEERTEADGSETNLFGEDLTLTLGGSVMRHEIEIEAPTRFDWKETAPFIFMGGVGLVSFGASMAAFRRAAEQSGGSELTIIGWVLALIGLGCVGVSSINLYRKFGLPGGD